MTLAKPMFPPRRANPAGAPGASSLCPVSLIPASRPGASQPLASEGEPQAMPPTCLREAGQSMTRRNLMNLLVTAAGAVASSVALPSPSVATPLPENSDTVTALAGEPEARAMTLAELRRGPLVHEGSSFPEYPPEIFGKLPEGFVLEEQGIEMLCFWHRKAIEVLRERSEDGIADEELNDYCAIKNRILEAVLSARAATSGQVAAQLRAVLAEIDCLGGTVSVSIEEVLDVDHIVKMSAELTMATAQIVPKKRVGHLQRGRKLTRAGLLMRYQSYLVQELETVSWNLYGEPDYAKHTIFFDRAVRERCTSANDRGPFFSERNLPDRARAVLGSLKIDTEIADARS
jgi:hypothetical protein